jgi:ABC-2 type transport system permease protein
MSFVRTTLLIFQRYLRISLRNPAWVVIGLLQPVLYLALFGPLLSPLGRGAVDGFPSGNSYQFFVPGLLVQLGMFGSAFVGFGIIIDLRSGVLERLRVTAASPLALLLGRVLRDVLVLLVQAVLLVLVGLAFGLRAPLGGVLISFGFVAVLAVSLSSLSYGTGLKLKNEDALGPALNLVAVPAMLLSGILLPISLAPSWLNWVSRLTPFRYIIDAMREAFRGNYATTLMLEGVGVSVGLAVVCLVFASRAFQRA